MVRYESRLQYTLAGSDEVHTTTIRTRVAADHSDPLLEAEDCAMEEIHARLDAHGVEVFDVQTYESE